jgi:hypothetical protein
MNYTVKYSDNLPDGFGARCYNPLVPMFGTCKIVVRHKYKYDIGLLNHEIVHAKQYRRHFFHGLVAMISKKYRLKAELEAYSAQIDAYEYKTIDEAMWIVNALHSKYNLDMSIDELRGKVEALIEKSLLII